MKVGERHFGRTTIGYDVVSLRRAENIQMLKVRY
jgi:hypothetical protein